MPSIRFSVDTKTALCYNIKGVKKLEIRNTTVYNIDNILKFNRYLGFGSVFKKIVGIVMLAIMVSLNVFNLLFIGLDLKLIKLTLLWVILMAFYCFLYLVLPRITSKKAISFNSVVNYTFKDDELLFEASGPKFNETATLKYSTFKKIVKNRNMIYLFIAEARAYIIDISKMYPTDLHMIECAFRKHLPDKKIKWK